MDPEVSIPLLNVEEGYGLFLKSNYQTRLHRHYVIEAILCEGGYFDIYTEQASYRQISAVVIPSGLPHRFLCTEPTCKLLFADPLSPLGRFVNERYQLETQPGITVNPPELETLFDPSVLCGDDESEFITPRVERDLDFRIRRCLDVIRADAGNGHLSIQQLSHSTFLSAGRLSHLFKAETGVSIHQYILWKKICVAASRVMAGFSLTDGAHYAGFADSAHFHKVFSRMFGINPFVGLKS